MRQSLIMFDCFEQQSKKALLFLVRFYMKSFSAVLKAPKKKSNIVVV